MPEGRTTSGRCLDGAKDPSDSRSHNEFCGFRRRRAFHSANDSTMIWCAGMLQGKPATPEAEAMRFSPERNASLAHSVGCSELFVARELLREMDALLAHQFS